MPRDLAPSARPAALPAQLQDLPARVSLLDLTALLARLLPTSADPADPRVRLVHASDLGFHGGEVVALELRGDTLTVTTSLPGLCGAETPLPLYLADDIDSDDEHGAAIRGHLDVVHHRLLTLLLGGLGGLDLPATLRPDARDAWSARLLALAGPAALAPALRLRLLPLLAAGPRSAEALAAALRLALAEHLPPTAALRVDTWTGGFAPIGPDQWTRLGEPSAALGDTALLGAEIFHPAGAARIVVGPLRGDEAPAFARDGPAHALAAAVCDAFAPAPLRFELVLDIEDMSYAPCLLGQRRLGEDLWLSAGDHPGTRARRSLPLRVGAPA